MLRPKFDSEQIREIMKERLLRIETAILSRLQRVGEKFVKNARENGSYGDRTGNLRSSIGYVILKDGVQLNENFQPFVVIEKDGKKITKKLSRKKDQDGTKVAIDLIKKAAKQFPEGYVLIVVAAMDYAAAVESKGLDVLTASSIIAKNDLYRAITDIQNKIGKMR